MELAKTKATRFLKSLFEKEGLYNGDFGPGLLDLIVLPIRFVFCGATSGDENRLL